MSESRIPEWLKPYLDDDTYTSTKDDILRMVPQSREEVLLKYIALNTEEESNYQDFITSDDEDFIDVDGLQFTVRS